MRRQVVIIHGGGVRVRDIARGLSGLVRLIAATDTWLKPYDWKKHFSGALGERYEVIAPQMPHSMNAKYEEWKTRFEELFPQLQHDVILIGHSLGGIFLSRYLSEEWFPKKIRATFLVAAPYDFSPDIVRAGFGLTPPLTKFEQQGGKIVLFQSKDDPLVPFSEIGKYQAQLPHAVIRLFSQRRHFNQKEFPELVSLIQSLY